MSRQMAFQFSGLQLCAMVEKTAALVGDVTGAKLEAALTEKFLDVKEQRIARTTILVLVKCYDENKDYRSVRKVIVWRDKDGQPKDIQIEF